jgi:hypothetical protein
MQSDAQSHPWPFQKIERTLSLPPRARRCVLLTTGALNPVHLGHVAMFDKAKICFEAEFGLEVVGGFLSPSHDRDLLGKYGDSAKFFSAEKRIEMCIAATRGHPILSVGTWESSVRDRWPDFPEVTQALGSALKASFAGDAPLVLYLCGEDHPAPPSPHVQRPHEGRGRRGSRREEHLGPPDRADAAPLLVGERRRAAGRDREGLAAF